MFLNYQPEDMSADYRTHVYSFTLQNNIVFKIESSKNKGGGKHAKGKHCDKTAKAMWSIKLNEFVTQDKYSVDF